LDRDLQKAEAQLLRVETETLNLNRLEGKAE